MPEPKGSKDVGAMPAAMAGGRSSSFRAAVDASPARPGEVPRDPRVALVASLKLRYTSILDFYESQSINISRTGMFVASNMPAQVGSLIDFDFSLDDGLSLLRGRGEVVRVTQAPVMGMGVRFRELDEESRRCLEGIVATNEREGRKPQIPIDFNATPAPPSRSSATMPVVASARSSHPLHGATRVQPGLTVNGLDLQIRLTPLTVGYFTNNPLINIRLGGFVIPIDDDVSLGAMFDVAIVDNDGMSLFHGKGKVVAKHERRIGIRLADVDKAVLGRLQSEVGRLSPGGR
jgi:uncharacterized protein (TIGR02266 family)